MEVSRSRIDGPDWCQSEEHRANFSENLQEAKITNEVIDVSHFFATFLCNSTCRGDGGDRALMGDTPFVHR